MPFQIRVYPDHNLILSHGTGQIKPQEIADALHGVTFEAGFHPGMDRLTVLSQTASLSQIDNAHLRDFKRTIQKAETPETNGAEAPAANGPAPTVRFRNAFVCPKYINRMIVSLYASAWESDSAADAEFEIFQTLTGALRWLGRPETLLSLHPKGLSEPLQGAL